MHSMPAARFT
ncbi:hypothetical protein ZEAMMB73_Zm00001d025855 [Zea mays]|uniref:Uncharacterized protein n=1 Tax=Zea mays TaxID=4577 RepID=A0A1D6JAE6_MAIZE|nr:hypothetical protein ZEAMMB73_Zm00001d025855 [Zea mays]AQK44878.1 hypothetical protein ZEAMMB73_Zm00001d025855 [Zea mays]AQK44879.1 hypothetical protein ZEAMMB73_Zm00001d025855 [Zea mays]